MGESDIYRQLQQHLDKSTPVGLPATESGVELRCLKQVFTPEDAELTLMLGPLPETVEEIYPRVKETGMSIEELEEKLDLLVMKGLILGGKLTVGEKGEKRYSVMGWAIGIWEFQIDRLTKELVEARNEYEEEVYYKAWFKPDTPAQMRTIPVGHSITVEHHVSTYDDIRQIIENAKGPFALVNCICKQGMALVDQPCKVSHTQETCIGFGMTAEAVIDIGFGREVIKEEIFDALQKFEDIGLVLQPENAQNPRMICSCCGDCCKVLLNMKKFPRPAELYTSNYFAVVDPEECEGCKTCIDRCQIEAVSMVDEVSTVNLDRCIGCGLCVTTCPSDAIQLQKKEKEVVPPKDMTELYQKIMMKKMGMA